MPKFIAHRGNTKGSKPYYENSINYIQEAFRLGFDVEVDVWKIDSYFYLGHDGPQYPVTYEWLKANSDRLWLHCKNVASLCYFTGTTDFNCFSHDKDSYTLTSKGFIWCLPGATVVPDLDVVQVLPERTDAKLIMGVGFVCSDLVEVYQNER